MKRAVQAFASIIILFGLWGVAHAATGPYGRDWNHGYLTDGVQGGNLNWVFVPFPAANYTGLGPGCDVACTVTEASFIQVFQDRLYDPDQTDSGRAAAIIDIMLGNQGPDFGDSIPNGIAYAQAHFQDWKDLVDLYAQGVNGYSVNWNDYIDFTGVNVSAMGQTNGTFSDWASCFPVSTYQCLGDITFFNTFNDPEFDYAVVFTAGSNRFMIKHKCGNPTGDSNGLPRPTTSINLTKTSSSPSTPLGSTIQYKIHAQEADPIKLNTVTITDTLPAQFQYLGPAGGPAPTSVSGQTLTWTFNSPPDDATLDAIYNGGIDLSVNVKAVSTGFGITNTATGTATDEFGDNVPVGNGSTTNDVISTRYPSVLGLNSDIHADNNACKGVPGSGGVTANPNANTYGDYVISTPGSINNFPSNAGQNTGSDLSIGNNGAYSSVCRPDLYAYASTHPPTGVIPLSGPNYSLNSDFNASPNVTVVGGTKAVAYITSGNVTLSGTYSQTLPLTIVASGDVTISGNLLVDGGGGTDRSSLPSVGIIAGGNIYIKSAATQVDAMLVSNDGIYTCDGPGIPVFPNCDNTLTVNGFLMGRNLFLGRLGS